MRRLLLVVVALLLPACGGEEGTPDDGAPAGGAVVDVALRDFTIEPSAIAVDPGSYTFRVVNEGEPSMRSRSKARPARWRPPSSGPASRPT